MSEEKWGPTVVIDNGTGFIKAGYGGETSPRVVFPTVVGTLKYEEAIPGGGAKTVYVGDEAIKMRGLLVLKYPMRHGIIEDREAMEHIRSYTFYKKLRVNPKEHPVVLTEPPLNPRPNRVKMAEIMFEKFEVPAMYVATQAVLALYAAGHVTGLVVDIGAGVTHIVPVKDSFIIKEGVRRLDLAGMDITDYLAKLLQTNGVFTAKTSAEKDIVNDIKEKCCYVALDYEAELEKARKDPDSVKCEYTLPDGKKIYLTVERFMAPEILFKPSMIGLESKGVHELIFDAIMAAPIDVRPDLFNKIILSGGTTMLPGLAERLKKELEELVVKHYGYMPPNIKIDIKVRPDRKYLVRKGGALLAKLPEFKQMLTTREQRKELGDAVVDQRTI